MAILYADVAGYSRLTGADEVGTHKQLGAALDLISGRIERAGGRVVHYAGDAVLATFESVVGAVETAVGIQSGLAESTAHIPSDKRLAFRIGVNLGEVIVDRDDIYGDGVNVAARLEGLADIGGICISSTVHDQVRGKLDIDFHDMGPQQVKNIADPVHVFAVRMNGDGGGETGTTPSPIVAPTPELTQEVRFCTASDGIGLAYSTVGEGPPLVKTANFLSHLEFEWESPVWRHLLRELSREHALIRYDERGSGLSDRRVDDFTVETHVGDLEAVIEATNPPKFDLFAVSQGCSIAITYAVRHPERVSRLVLYGGFAEGWKKRVSPAAMESIAAMVTLIRQGWGQANPAFRQMVTALFLPDGTPEHLDWFDELERKSTSPENAAKMFEANGEIDVAELLPRVSVPTLVLHSQGDAVSSHKAGREMAAKIPGARFVSLDSKNHVILEHEAAWPRLRDEIRNFLRVDSGDP